LPKKVNAPVVVDDYCPGLFASDDQGKIFGKGSQGFDEALQIFARFPTADKKK
jgi:hypothetical protein